MKLPNIFSKDVKIGFQGEKPIKSALKWGVLLGATLTAALTQGSRLNKLNGDFTLPTGFGEIIVGILLLIFLSSKRRRVKRFKPHQTFTMLGVTVVLFLVNIAASDLLTISYPPQSKVGVVDSADYILMGWYKREDAKRYQDTTRPSPTNAELLYDFNSDVSAIWSPGSVVLSKLSLYLLYLTNLTLLLLTIIAAFDISTGGTVKARRTTKRKRSTSS